MEERLVGAGEAAFHAGRGWGQAQRPQRGYSPHLLSGRGGERGLAQIQRKRGRGFYRSKRKGEHFKRFVEVARETVIIWRIFPWIFKNCLPLIV